MPIELLLEARDEGARTELERDVVAGAALERHAVDLAGEVDHDTVAGLGLAALGLGRERPVLLGDLRQRLIDLGVGDLGVRRSSSMPLKSASSIFGRISSATV